MYRLIVTCEHGGNRVPAEYRRIFRSAHRALESHRGYDAGALTLARDLARAFGAELIYSTTSRLVVELNRSARHVRLFSSITRALPRAERERIVERYYRPYRERVETAVCTRIENGARVVHISSHSFTPRLNGATRHADVGLLYDPRRRFERALCLAWQDALRRASPRLRVRRNYPYRGSDDGLTTHLRRLHREPHYTGIEIEVNQKHSRRGAAAWRPLRKLLVSTLRAALECCDRTRAS